METSTTEAVVRAPEVGRDVHARLAGTRPNQNGEAPPFWGDDGFTFGDLIDLLNPLRHIPLVGSLYRGITGDEIAPGPRILGGAVFGGGPIGAAIAIASGAANATLEQKTGRDMGGHVLSWVGFDPARGPSESGAPKMVAEVNGMPWLAAGPLQQGAPVQTAAVTVAPEAMPQPAPRPVQQTMAREKPAATALARQIPVASAVIETPAPASKLTEEQWAMLVASVGEDSAGPTARVPLPQMRTGDGQGDAKVRPADLAATMMLALDRYEAISHARNLETLTE